MNKSVLMIMGGALAVAVLVALVVQSKLSPKSSSGGPAVEILVANKKLLLGTRIKAEDVRWQAWPEAASFKGVIKKADQKDIKKLDVFDAPLRRDIESGEPLTRQAIIADVKGEGNFLAASIMPGMRAVSVPVKPDTGAGGFVSPGDRVDVILSYSAKLSRDASEVSGNIISRYASQTVLSNVRVLAVDQKSKSEQEAKVAKTVTLEVTREGAEIVTLAKKMGDISLSLRRLGEKDKPQDMLTPITTDATTSEVIRKVNDLVQKSNTKTSNAVRVYSGNAVQNVPVRSTEQ